MSMRIACVATMIVALMGAKRVAAQGMVASYKFENNLADSSGNGYTGTIAGGTPTYVAGRTGYGQALHIDNDGDSVTWANLPKPTAITASIWVRLDPASPVDKSWLLDDLISVAGVGWRGWQFKVERLADISQVHWILADIAGVRQTTTGTAAGLYSDQWHHIVGTHDGINTARLYYDGKLVAQKTSASFAPAPASKALRLNNITDDQFDGDVDDVTIWNRALTAAEVQSLFNDGFISMRMSVAPGDQAATALEGFATPAPTLQPYIVTNQDSSASHTFSISEVDAGGNATNYPWLTLSASQLVIPAASNRALTATINHVSAALPPGEYTAYLKFSDDSMPPVTLTRQMQLTVIGCQWSVTPNLIRRYYLHGSGGPAVPAVFTVTNTGKHGLTYTAQEVVDGPWVVLDKPGGGPLNYQATSTVTATINPAGLALGEYTCDIRFTNNCSPAEQVIVRLTLGIVEPSASPFVISYYDNGFESIPITDTGYANLAECNMNVINSRLGSHMSPWIDPDLAQAYGLKCMVDWDYNGLGTNQFPYDPIAIDANAQSLANMFGSHPAVLGYRLRDEPSADEWPQIGLAHQKLLQYDPDCLPWVNILPNYSYGQYGTGIDSHTEYLDTFMSTVQPKVLCFDEYTAVYNNIYPPDVYPLYWHYSNLKRFRDYGVAYGIPYWKIIESNLFNTSPNTEGILRFQAYSALAYGFKGILYFTYTTQSEGSDSALAWGKEQSGTWGTLTSKGTIASTINGEMKILGTTLRNLRSWDVQFNDPPVFPGYSYVPTVDRQTFAGLNGFYVTNITGGKALCGNLTDGNRTWMLFVNEDWVNARTISIGLNASHVAGLGRVSKTTGRLVLTSTPNSTLTLALSAGNGELYKVLLDTTAASVPVDVTDTPLSTRILVNWPDSSDPQSGIDYYVLYRDGLEIGTSESSDYVDIHLQPNTTYKYEVSAVNGEGVESAKSSPVWLTTPLPCPADFDGDGDVDNADMAAFADCTGGPGMPYAATCALPLDGLGRPAADFDKDNDVDQSDFGLIQRCHSGTDVPASPSCSD